jgi:hypothetical protein
MLYELSQRQEEEMEAFEDDGEGGDDASEDEDAAAAAAAAEAAAEAAREQAIAKKKAKAAAKKGKKAADEKEKAQVSEWAEAEAEAEAEVGSVYVFPFPLLGAANHSPTRPSAHPPVRPPALAHRKRIADEKASAGPSPREEESAMIAAQLSAESAANPGRSGSVIKEIPSDGHCMYRAFADQVSDGACHSSRPH